MYEEFFLIFFFFTLTTQTINKKWDLIWMCILIQDKKTIIVRKMPRKPGFTRCEDKSS